MLATIEDHLLEEQRLLEQEIARLMATDTGGCPPDLADRAQMMTDLDEVARELQRAVSRLAEVQAAQQRLRDGSYGVCEVCGAKIDAARLEVRPIARTCVTHASRRH